MTEIPTAPPRRDRRAMRQVPMPKGLARPADMIERAVVTFTNGQQLHGWVCLDGNYVHMLLDGDDVDGWTSFPNTSVFGVGWGSGW
jgi:hypothetical protein